jgi:hypothetical protein
LVRVRSRRSTESAMLRALAAALLRRAST